jgi:hypothetical protein
MPGPAAFPYLCPPLGCLSRIHMSTLDKRTDERPGRQDDEQLSCRIKCSFREPGGEQVLASVSGHDDLHRTDLSALSSSCAVH